MQAYNKAIMSILGGVLTLATAFGLNLGVSEEFIAAIGTVITTLLVFFVPNKPAT